MIQLMILVLLKMTLLVILILALLAPLEFLEWWVRHYPTSSLPTLKPELVTGVRRFAVYLSGIAMPDGGLMSCREHAVLGEVRKQLPDMVTTEDMFPYAMGNRGLPQCATVWLRRCLD